MITKERMEFLNYRYKQCDLKTELRETVETIRCGYIDRDNAEFIAWLCQSALEEIEEQEKLVRHLCGISD